MFTSVNNNFKKLMRKPYFFPLLKEKLIWPFFPPPSLVMKYAATPNKISRIIVAKIGGEKIMLVIKADIIAAAS